MRKFTYNVGDKVLDTQGQEGIVIARYRLPKVAAQLSNPECGLPIGNRIYVVMYRAPLPCSAYGCYSTCQTFVWEESFLTRV